MFRENCYLGNWQSSDGQWVNYVNRMEPKAGDYASLRPTQLQQRNQQLLQELTSPQGADLLARLNAIPHLAVPAAPDIDPQAALYRLPQPEGQWFFRSALENRQARADAQLKFSHLFWAAAQLCDTLAGLNRENLLACQIGLNSLLLQPRPQGCGLLLLDFHALPLWGSHPLFNLQPAGKSAFSLLDNCLFSLNTDSQEAMKRFLQRQKSPLSQQLQQLRQNPGQAELDELKQELLRLAACYQAEDNQPKSQLHLYIVLFPGQRAEPCPLSVGWLCQCLREELAANSQLEAAKVTCIYADHGLRCLDMNAALTPELALDADADGASYGEILDLLRCRLLAAEDETQVAKPLVYYYFPLGGNEKFGSRRENYQFNYNIRQLYQMQADGQIYAFCTVQNTQVYGDDSWKLLTDFPHSTAQAPSQLTAIDRESLCRLLRDKIRCALDNE